MKVEQYLRKGDILVCTSSGSKELVGKSALIIEDLQYSFGAFCKVIRTNNELAPNYLSKYFQSNKYKNIISKSSNGANINNLRAEDFDNLELEIIPYDSQLKVSNKLEKVIELVELKKSQIEELDNLIKSQFVEMFENDKFEIVKLSDVCDVRDGTHDSPSYLPISPYKFVTSKNLVNGEICFDEVKYIQEEDYNKFNERSKVNFGDILMPMIGTVGNPVIINIKDENIDFAIKNVALIKFYKNSKVSNIYVKNLLSSDSFNKMLEYTKKGGTQQFVALKDIRNFEIKLPPIELQNRFADFVQHIDKLKFVNLYHYKIPSNSFNFC